MTSFVSMNLLLLFLILLCLTEGKKVYPDYGHKLKQISDKIISTSSKVEGSYSDWFKEHNVPMDQMNWFNNKYKDCLKLDLHVPESYDSLYICLKKQTAKFSAFHKNFRLNIYKKNGKEILTLDDVLKRAVQGHVLGMGVSFVRGYMENGNFYGTIVYSHLIRKQIITCTVYPDSMIKNYVEWEVLDEATANKLYEVKSKSSGKNNAIVSCGDMHKNDENDVENPFTFLGGHNPTNVIFPKRGRVKRNDEPFTQTEAVAPADSEAETTAEPSVDIAATRPNNFETTENPPDILDASVGGLPPGPVQIQKGRSLIAPDKPIGETKNVANETDSDSAKKKSNLAKAAQQELKNYLKLNKHGTYFARACYTVDSDFMTNRLKFSSEDVTLMIGAFVEFSDWILRSTDWNKDGFPDNIGIRLLEVNVDFITKDLRGEGDSNKWGREEGGKFDSRKKVFDVVKELGTKMNTDCDIRSAIGNVNAAKFIFHEPGGCTACKDTKLTSFMNPYVEKYSPRGEYMRMMYHQIRLLTFSLVHTNSYCANCTDNGGPAKHATVAGSFDSGDPNWGSCIVEGDLQSRSNLPLNTFRLSTCSQEDGLKCLTELGSKNNCLDFESEENYCGNGIVEGDEECDCGTLATCAEQHCTCSPRTGLNPCRKLQDEETRLCYTLIRCRGFRFLYEVGRSNGSHFLAALPDLLLHDGSGLSSRQGTGMKLSAPGFALIASLIIFSIFTMA